MKKKNRIVRVCADLSTSLKTSLNVHQYPAPHLDELFAKLSRGVRCGKITLKNIRASIFGRRKLEVCREKYAQRVVQMHQPVDLASSSSTRKYLHGSKFAAAYLDDIVVTSRNKEEHLPNQTLLSFCKGWKGGLTVKNEKCNFVANSVKYLGYH